MEFFYFYSVKYSTILLRNDRVKNMFKKLKWANVNEIARVDDREAFLNFS